MTHVRSCTHRRGCDGVRALRDRALPAGSAARPRAPGGEFEPSVIDTPFGRVEYAQAGDGPPVMVVHGVFGGFDFGVGVGRVNVPRRLSDHLAVAVRVLWVAAPAGSFSPAAQADAFAALLDHLEITRAAGGRVLGGKLVRGTARAPAPGPRLAAGADLAERAASRAAAEAAAAAGADHLQPAGVLGDAPARALAPGRACREPRLGSCPTSASAPRCARSSTACSRSALARAGRSTTATSATSTSPPIRSSRSRSPTLVVHAEDDTLSPYRDSRAMAERIPGARFVTVRRGGHTLTQLDAGARRAVEQFLDAAGRQRRASPRSLPEGGR